MITPWSGSEVLKNSEVLKKSYVLKINFQIPVYTLF